MTGIWRLRAAVLTLAGVLGVHQGRYLFATSAHEHELSAAHAYLTWLGPLAGVLVFLAAVQFVAHVHSGGAPSLPRARSLWLTATVTLLVVFGVQESLETYLAHGQVPGLLALLGAGGWTAVPLALAAGAAIALLLRGAARVVARACRDDRRWPRADLATALPATPVRALRGSVLARRLAGRGPPLSV